MVEGVPIGEAKTHLSQLVKRAHAGEHIVIRRGDRPMARLVPYDTPAVARRPGRMRGALRIADDFDDDLPEEMLAAFESM